MKYTGTTNRMMIVTVAALLLLCLFLPGCNSRIPETMIPEETISPPVSTDGAGGPPATAPAQQADAVTLWYSADNPAGDALEEIIKHCSAEAKNGIIITVFPTGDRLNAALENGRPDIALVSMDTAAALVAAGKTTDTGSCSGMKFRYREELYGVVPDIGTSVFPVGFTVPVLAVNTGKLTQILPADVVARYDLRNMQDVFELACRMADAGVAGCLEIYSFARLFDAQLNCSSELFTGSITGTDVYREFYNSVADAFFCGGVDVADEQTQIRIEEGNTALYWTTATEYAGYSGEEISFFALRNTDGEPVLRAEGYAFVSLCGEEKSGVTATVVAELFKTAQEGDSIATCGLLPAMESGYPCTGLGACLESVYRDYVISLICCDELWVSKAGEFETEFLSKMAYLRP